MRINSDFIIHDTGYEHVIIASGKSFKKFSGIARCNETTAFIFKCLEEETTIDEIVEKMYKEYDADKETIKSGVLEIIEDFRKLDAIIE